MAASQVDKSFAMFTTIDFRLRVQSCQSGLGQWRVAAATLSPEDHDHGLFVPGFELVVGGDDVRRDFMPQRPGMLCERRLRAFWPAVRQKNLGVLQRNQFDGRVMHGLFLFQWVVRFYFG